VVERIDEDSRQLAEALANAVPIIITTLQKFPFVSRQLLKMAEERGEADGTCADQLPTRCAVIIDEAHSSQSGETATELKAVLGGEALRDKALEHWRLRREPRTWPGCTAPWRSAVDSPT
jgi:type I restriction enzyme R subunit